MLTENKSVAIHRQSSMSQSTAFASQLITRSDLIPMVMSHASMQYVHYSGNGNMCTIVEIAKC